MVQNSLHIRALAMDEDENNDGRYFLSEQYSHSIESQLHFV